MNIRFLLIVLLILAGLFGCENSQNIDTAEINVKWEALYTKGGCLTGGQHWGPGASEGSIFRKKEWKQFFEISPKLSIPFLAGRIDSKIETNVHVCPFHMASEGELAVYASEHILKQNWFDSDSYYKELAAWSEKRDNTLTPITKLMLDDARAKNELRSLFLSKI
jgi:hypothetical protein